MTARLSRLYGGNVRSPPDTIATVELPAPFEPVGEHIGIALPGGRALFTTRRGGVSSGPYESLNLGPHTDDDPEDVERNRRILATHLDVALDAVVQTRQVHSTRIEQRIPGDGALDDADGQVTAEPGLVLMALTADCLPIALIAPHAVAILHAGWRGLADGIVEEGVRALGSAGARAAIGPGIGACCYEVGADVAARFGEPAGRLDLKAIARARLLAAGVSEVHDAGLCTRCADPTLFFSHRRDGGITGRQAGVAWRS
jgi:polyphenol oxidase